MVSTSAHVAVAADERHGAPAPADGKPARLRLDFIDGLRGLAALAVVLLHAFEALGIGWMNPPGYGIYIDGPLGAGLERVYQLVVLRFAWAVELFIVISGFSLMLPIARSREQRLAGGYVTFIGRRARRILPPYFAAMVFSLLLIALVPGMGQPSERGHYWDIALPAFTPGMLLSHLFLVHNWSPEWATRIDPPMWSIAVEWQIYLVFPLLVLVARRWGAVAALLLGLTVGIAQGYGETLGLRAYPFSYPWYLGLFSLGMFAAWLCFGAPERVQRWRDRVPWLAVAAVAFVAMFGLKVFGLRALSGGDWITDPLLGVAAAALLVSLTLRPRSALCRVTSLPWVVRLGHASYSLYLVHAPVLALVALAVLGLGVDGPQARLAVILLGPLAALLVTYPFYLAFERPFTRPPQPRVKVVEQPA
jgi:peptidoglycan/LPS O-acetylase OafA/YrhL